MIFEVDHISRTVPDLAAAIQFYRDTFGAEVLYQLGPIDGTSIPRGEDGLDWMASHVGVEGACLTLAMLQLTPDLKLQLVQYDKPTARSEVAPRNCDVGGHHIALRVNDVTSAAEWLQARGCEPLQPIAMSDGPLAGKTNLYVRDPMGLYFELVD